MTAEEAQKLKPGDLVVCLRSSGNHRGAYKPKHVYKIIESSLESDTWPWLRTVDEQGEVNGWGIECFEIIYDELGKTLFKS